MRMWHHYSSHSVNYSCGRRRKDIEANEKLYTPLPPFFFLLFSHSPGKCQISTQLQARLNHPTSQHASHVTDTYEEGTRRDDNVIQGQAATHTHTHWRYILRTYAATTHNLSHARLHQDVAYDSPEEKKESSIEKN